MHAKNVNNIFMINVDINYVAVCIMYANICIVQWKSQLSSFVFVINYAKKDNK